MQEEKSIIEVSHVSKFFGEKTALDDVYSQEIICPIISGGDVMGTVVFLHKEEHKKFSEVEEKMAAVAAEFLGRQMEQ